MDEKSIRVIQPEVGGGFGVKVELYPEDVLIPVAALRVGRPMKWIEDRRPQIGGTTGSRTAKSRRTTQSGRRERPCLLSMAL